MPAPVRAADAQVFAAASLTDVMEKLAQGFESETGRTLTMVPGSSSTLARQIEAGAPADFFISANKVYADLVADVAGVEPLELFGNSLAIIAPVDFKGTVRLEGLAEALGSGRLAVGDPAHVPAGIYAKEALEKAGVWDDLKDRLAPGGDVRAALAFVAQGAAPFGIVYKTDAMAEGVRIAGEIDPALHTPIRYWGVLVNKDNEAAEMFLGFAGSPEGQNLLAGAGFETVVARDD